MKTKYNSEKENEKNIIAKKYEKVKRVFCVLIENENLKEKSNLYKVSLIMMSLIALLVAFALMFIYTVEVGYILGFSVESYRLGSSEINYPLMYFGTAIIITILLVLIDILFSDVLPEDAKEKQ